MASYISHFECSRTGETYPARAVHGLSRAGGPLLARYDLAALKGAVSREALAKRTGGLWRYHEFLPVEMEKNRISLGEVMTPLIRAPRIEALRGGADLYVKDESRLPAGSAMARGLALAVSMARELRLNHLAMAADGAAGVALAAYAARAGLRATIFCSDDAAPDIIGKLAARRADVIRVNGRPEDCARIVREGTTDAGWFDVTPTQEPYFIEGMKTAGLELAEQCGWKLPAWIFLGEGPAVDALAKAFDELEAIGWIGPGRPSIVAVAVDGAIEAHAEMAREEGLLLSPDGAAAYAAYVRAVAERRVKRGERAVLFNGATLGDQPPPPIVTSVDRDAAINYAQFRLKSSRDA